MGYNIINPGLAFPQARTKRTSTEGILVHHCDAQWDVWKVHDYHTKTNGWNGIGYNYYIHKDGTIYLGRGQEYAGAHCPSHNSKTIGICCQGRYHNADTSMPDTQYNALIWLITYLKGIYGSGIYIKGHKEVYATACPGQYFPLAEVKTLKYRGTTNNKEDEDMTEAQVLELIKRTCYTQVQTEEAIRADCYLKSEFPDQVTAVIESREESIAAVSDPSEWAKAAWGALKAVGIMDGTMPHGNVTREQLAVVLNKLGVEAFAFYDNVSDCPDWMQGLVQAMVDAGFISGDGTHAVGKYHYQLEDMIVAYKMYKDAVAKIGGKE